MVFSTLDSNLGYRHVFISEEYRDNTAFMCHKGLYHITRMPFRLTYASATLQREIDIQRAMFKWNTCLVYLDDIIVISNSLDDHLSIV